MSFLEMLDVLNEDLNSKGEPPVAFENDCREGICGSCGFLVNGVAHGGRRGTTVCQLSMRFFKDGDSLVLEPWRARAFPVLRDLLVDRSPFDRIIQAGGFISAPTGAPVNAILVPKASRIRLSTRQPASDAAHAWQPAPTRPPCCSPRPNSPISIPCPRDSRSAISAHSTWSRPCRPNCSAVARTTASAKRCAPRKSRWNSSAA